MKTSIFILLTTFSCLFISLNSVHSQVAYNHQIDSIVNLVSLQSISKFNRELSGDTSTTIGGQPYTIISRYWEHAGNQKAAQYIYEKFLSFGLDTRYQIYRPNGVNVIAEKIGTKYPNQQFIICAHYDDGPILFPPFSDTIPGADDNASGVSTVLEAARVLSSFNFDYTLIFIAFDEEERVPNGSYGSRAYSDSAFANHDSIVGVMNLDMIAWDINKDFNFVVTTDSNSVMLADDMIAASLLYQPNLVPLKNIGFYGSDQLEFWRNGFVAIAPHEGDFNPYWHTVNDKFSNLNLPYFMSITKAVVGAFASLGWDFKINFIHTPIENSSDTTAKIATVVINSSHQIATGSNAPRLYYKVGTGQFYAMNAFYSILDTFKFSIPGQSFGSEVSYFIAAQDSAGTMVGTLPSGGKGFSPPGSIPPPTLFIYNIQASSVSGNTYLVKFSLLQNYPNPFNPKTKIKVEIAKLGNVKLVVYDILGREVAKLVNEKLKPGTYEVEFDGNNYSSGVYFYKLITNDFSEVKKMLLIK